MGKDVLFSGSCRDVKYLTHAFKMCQGLEVEGLRYETGVIRVWFGYDSRSTIQHTVSDLDRATTASQHQKLVDANGIGCHNEATAASQHRSCLQPTWLHRAARLRGWRAGWRKGRLKAAWSKCRDPSWYIWAQDLQITTINNPSKMIFILGVCFGVCFGGMLRGMLRGYASQERHLPPIHI